MPLTRPEPSELERLDISGLPALLVPGDPAASVVKTFKTLRKLMDTFLKLWRCGVGNERRGILSVSLLCS